MKDEESYQAGRHVFMHTYLSDLKALKFVNTYVFTITMNIHTHHSSVL